MNSAILAPLPDPASSNRPPVGGNLDAVGMSGLALPFTLADAERDAVPCQGSASFYVSLSDPHAKGIHMSRLYLLLDAFAGSTAVTPASLRRLLEQALDSHRGLSDVAALSLDFRYLSRRPALASDNQGWQAYSVCLGARRTLDSYLVELDLTIPYSSTCPCSASLSRQLIAEAMQQSFQDRSSLSVAEVRDWLQHQGGSWATPHSQRSFAKVRVRLAGIDTFPLERLIGIVEGALQTPVQTAVKREDEQAFARLNGQNLMFCEDAARRIKAALDGTIWIEDFRIRVEHQESLHAHDAVAMAVKGIPGGYDVTW